MSSQTRSRRSSKGFIVVGVVVALLLAGVVSFYASGSPDGLNRVAEDQGFAGQERDSATADSPLADYAVVDIGDERLSGAISGVAGVLVVLLVAGGIAYLVRRRDAPSAARTD